jgi:hypothetical protein
VIVLACGNEPFRPETPPPPGISIEYLAPYTAVARQRFSAGVVVFVRDEQSRGRFKVPVQFVPLENSGSVSSPTVLTDQYGKAHVEWTLDQKPGENTLRIIIEDKTRELRVTSAASGVNAPNSLPNMP